VRALQRLLTHSYSGKVLAVRRVTENNGKETPGVDQEIWDTPEKKTQAVHALKRRGYRSQPLRRVYIPKSDGKTMRQRHVKVQGEANPYDPTYETYFEEREGAHMLETFRGTRTLRYLWYEQRGLPHPQQPPAATFKRINRTRAEHPVNFTFR
jgi:hypothetical protein